jgi:hypothetical protein
MKYDDIIGRSFIPTFQSNIEHYEVRGYDEERKMILTKVIPKSGHSFDDEIEERYFIGAFETGDYKWAFPREDDGQIFLKGMEAYLQLYESMMPKPRSSYYGGPCCGRCKNRFKRSEFCDKHEKDERCYRLKFDKNA